MSIIALYTLVGGNKAVVERFQGLGFLVKHPGIDLGCKQVVGSCDGVNVTSQMEIEFIHWNHLSNNVINEIYF